MTVKAAEDYLDWLDGPGRYEVLDCIAWPHRVAPKNADIFFEAVDRGEAVLESVRRYGILRRVRYTFKLTVKGRMALLEAGEAATRYYERSGKVK